MVFSNSLSFGVRPRRRHRRRRDPGCLLRSCEALRPCCEHPGMGYPRARATVFSRSDVLGRIYSPPTAHRKAPLTSRGDSSRSEAIGGSRPPCAQDRPAPIRSLFGRTRLRRADERHRGRKTRGGDKLMALRGLELQSPAKEAAVAFDALPGSRFAPCFRSAGLAAASS